MEYFIALSSLSVVRGEPKLNDLLSCRDIQHLGLFQKPAGLNGIDGNICGGKFCLFVCLLRPRSSGLAITQKCQRM